MSITSANAILTMSQPILFPTPQQIQEFGVDDIYDMDSVKSVETAMGVDGVLSFGFVWVPRMQNITLQANSGSIVFFDTIELQQQAAQDVYPLNGTIILPAVGKKFIMTNGGMTGYKPMPDGKKTLQPQRFQITWQKVVPAPI